MDKSSSPKEEKKGLRFNRENKSHSIAGSYTLFDTWIPSKLGLQYTYIEDTSTSWDISWDQGSIGYGFLFVDIAKISDQRLLLTRTSYSKRNSFYLTYGINYYKFKATLGSDLLSSVTNNNIPSVDVIELSSLGATFGIGSRWQFKNWFFGVNWISIHVPVVIFDKENAFITNTSSQSDRESVEDIINAVERIPTFTALRLQLGYSF